MAAQKIRLAITPEYLVNQRGANGIICEPFNPDELLAEIEVTLDRSAIAKRRKTVMDFSNNHVKSHSSTNKRVLIVADGPQFSTFIKLQLERHNFRKVDTAYSGREALAKIKASPPDVLITDVMMPEINGFQLIEAVRSDAALAGLPIIVMWAIAEDRGLTEEGVNFCLNRGADQVIGKPFNFRELAAYLHYMLFSPL